jgi:hypothetical protein
MKFKSLVLALSFIALPTIAQDVRLARVLEVSAIEREVEYLDRRQVCEPVSIPLMQQVPIYGIQTYGWGWHATHQQVIIGYNSVVSGFQSSERCVTERIPSMRIEISGYRVTYELDKRTKTVIMRNRPGDHVRIVTSTRVE